MATPSAPVAPVAAPIVADTTGRYTVRLCGTTSSPCGYCGGKRSHLVSPRSAETSSKSYGLLVSSITPHDYLLLINRGWRRSGQHLYKPDNWDSCCPVLTIRLKVDDFVSSKSQRSVIKKMNAALTTSSKKKKAKSAKRKTRQQPQDSPIVSQLNESTRRALQQVLAITASETATLTPLPPVQFKLKSSSKPREDNTTIYYYYYYSTICAAVAGQSKGRWNKADLVKAVVEKLKQSPVNSIKSIDAHVASGQVLAQVVASPPMTNGHAAMTNGDVEMPHAPRDLIADWLQTQKAPAASIPVGRLAPAQLVAHLPFSASNQPHSSKHHHSAGPASTSAKYDLQITTVPALESSLNPQVHRLYFDYQQKVHQDSDPMLEKEEADWGEASPDYIEAATKMLQQEYGVEGSAKMMASFSSFYRFLVESPVPTFHQHYCIADGIVIAVGVVDILPAGALSSVYAFYNAAFSHSICALGKFMILKEIEYCRDVVKLPHYYLGYYIYSCQKMKYKADYHPSELLCPVTFEWVDADAAIQMLERKSPERNCCQLHHPPTTVGEADAITPPQNAVAVYDPNLVYLDVGLPTVVTVNMLHPNGREIILPHVKDFMQQVGPTVAQQCILKLV